MRRLPVLAVLAAVLGLPGVAGAAGTTTIDFQAVAEDAVITNQYEGQGVLFGAPSDFGLAPAQCPQIRAQTLDGISGRSARISCFPAGEFDGPSVGAAFELESERRAVSLRLKATDDDIPVTVTIHAIGGTTLETRAITLQPNVAVTVAFTRALPEIVFVRISGGDINASYTSEVFMDDVSAPIEDIPPPPKFSLALQQPSVEIVEGSTVSVPVSVRRYNGSAGPVSLGVDGLPPGILGVQLTPNPVTGRNPSTLRISARSPLSGDRQLTVTASAAPGAPPGVGIPVGASGVQTVRAIPALAFDGRARGVVSFVRGCGGAFMEGVRVRGGYSGDISVNTQTLSGPSQPTTPGTIRVAGDGFVNFEYPMSFAGPGSGVIRLTLTPAAATPVSVDIPVQIAPPIASVSPSDVRTPQHLQPGTLVTLTGEGLCTSSNARVRFGNTNADAPIVSHSADGRTVTAVVPRLATTGNVQLVPDARNPGTVLDGPPVTVNSYRNTVGFAFPNYTPSLTVDQMSAAFGKNATHITVDACGVFSLGVVNCNVRTPIPDPWAMTVLQLANLTMGGDSGGACFGFSRTSQQLRRGRRAYTGLGNDAATNAFALPGSAGPNGSVNEAINAGQLSQLSSEYVGYYLSKAVTNQVAQTPASLRRDVEAHLRAGDDPLLSLRTGGSVSELHVVVAYDVENDPADANAYYISVYDSNMPFTAPGSMSGTTALTAEDSDAATHKQRAEGSRIHVRANGSWSMPSSSMSASSLGNIILGGLDQPPARPTLVTAKGALSNGISVLFGSAFGGLVGQAGAESAAPPAGTTQVSSGGRRLFSEPGVVNTDPESALKATPWVPATGTGSSVEGFILGAGAGADYTVDIKGTRAGTQTRTVLSRDAVSQVTSTTRVGVTDKLAVSPADAGIGFTSGGGAVSLTLESMARAADSTTRSVELKTRGSSDAIAFDRGRGGVRITHRGAPATVQLTLSSSGRGLPQAARVSLRLGGKGVTTIKPESWTRLQGGTLIVRANGRTSRLSLRAQRARGATVTGLTIAKRIARARVRVPAGVASGTATVTFAVTQGRRVLATRSLPAGKSGTRTLSWRLPAKAGRRSRVTAVATTIVPNGTIFNTAVSRRSARLP